MSRDLDKRQQKQENRYEFPYHWGLDPNSKRGRVYHGYISMCGDIAKRRLDKDSRVMDAGCGDGFFLHRLKESGFSNLVGLDYSSRAMEFTEVLVQGVDLLTEDITNIPLEGDSTDAIFMIETLEHIPPENIEDCMQEFNRILKPGGILVITVPSILMPYNMKHYQHFSPNSLKEAVKPYFKIEELKGQDKTGWNLWSMIDLLIENRFWKLKPLAWRFNERIWPQKLNECHADKGRRLVSICKKTNLS